MPSKEYPEKNQSLSGAINANNNIAAMETQYDKFHASQGHGFAAEQANHLTDILTGKNAVLVGGNNAKNGADRMVDGINIQTKYCQTASSSVSAAFDGGRYRYLNPDGTQMQLEVPKEQYEQAVDLMAKRIQNGQVPGVTDPKDAKDIVRKGAVTYEQAVNLAKSGTIESLTFDAINGAVICTSAFGISALITFARSMWNGQTVSLAMENALYSGCIMGGASFVTSVITSQIARTGATKVLDIPTETVAKEIGSNATTEMARVMRTGANLYGTTAMENFTKLFRGNIVAAGVMTLVLSAKDISNAFRGRISGKQLFKNITTLAGGVAGGSGGAALGSFLLHLIAPEAATAAKVAVSVITATVGGSVGGMATKKVLDHFIEEDAVELVKIVEERFCALCESHCLSDDEMEIVLDEISRVLDGEMLLEMFSSENRERFADCLIQEQMERTIRWRCRIALPSSRDMALGFGKLIEDRNAGKGIFERAAAGKPDPMEIGRAVTDRELPPNAARKGWYVTRQMNLSQIQTENRLRNMAAEEAAFQEDMAELTQKKADLKRALDELIRR